MSIFLFLGGEKSVLTKDTVGVFDIDKITVSKTTREFLSKAQRADKVETAGGDIPRSFVIVSKKDKNSKVFLSPSPTSTLKRRIEK